MKIKLQFFLLLLMCVFLQFGARADSVLFVAPTRINLDEKHKIEVINISNVSNVSRTYKINLENLQMTEQGVTKPSEDFPYSAKKMIRFFPRSFTVEPGQRQSIRVMAKIPADTPDGEYHVHINFFEDATEQGKPKSEGEGTRISAPLAYSTMLPITLSKGTIETKIGWVNPTVTKGEQPATYKLSTQLTRTGNGQGKVYMELIHVAADGKEVQIGNRRTVYIYREIDKLDFNYIFELPEGLSPAGKIKLRLLSGDPSNPVFVDQALLPIP